MKNYISLLLLLTVSASFAQKQTTEKFTSGIDTISFSRIDYSKYGISQVFIAMYEDIDANTGIMDKAQSCLSKEVNINHTYYYFIKLPKGTTQLQGEKIFSDFVAYLSEIEKIDKCVVIYLNSDKEYSLNYKNQKETPYPLRRVLTQTKTKNICARLSISR